jgi:hypothetical protein
MTTLLLLYNVVDSLMDKEAFEHHLFSLCQTRKDETSCHPLQYGIKDVFKVRKHSGRMSQICKHRHLELGPDPTADDDDGCIFYAFQHYAF